MFVSFFICNDLLKVRPYLKLGAILFLSISLLAWYICKKLYDCIDINIYEYKHNAELQRKPPPEN